MAPSISSCWPLTLGERAAVEASWRRHPLRRLNVARQSLQLRVGEFLLETFPFLRGPVDALYRGGRKLRLWR